MIRRRVPYLAIMATVASLLVVGCGEDSTGPKDGDELTQEKPSLDEPLGGYTSRPEQPCFGDPDLAASSDLETSTQDPILDDPDFVRWQRSDSVRVYALTLLWGILDSDPSIHPGDDGGGAENVDWSGSAVIDGDGALVVRATIAFEDDDYLVGPRIEREKVMWVSHTTGGFDGLRLMVLQRLHAVDDGLADSLTITAGVHRWIFAVHDLAELDRTDAVDGLGNKFAIRSFLMTPQLCNRGFLGGAWLAPRGAEPFGRFRGRWVATDGSVTGTVRGIWGTNSDGAKVFYGKYVDRSGNFRGIVRGSWDDRGADGPSQSNRLRTHGFIQGEWVDENGNALGSLRGHWRATQDGEDGFFEGAWKEGSCIGG
jgi:hypothetical protein